MSHLGAVPTDVGPCRIVPLTWGFASQPVSADPAQNGVYQTIR